MVAAREHLGHPHAAEVSRTRVLGIFQKAAGEGLVHGAVGRPQYAGQLAHGSIDDHHGSQLAGGEHVVAQRDDVVGQGVNALVDTLVVAADEQQVIGGGELIGIGVVEGAALGG